jgi:uncharacterized OsmC-like protein
MGAVKQKSIVTMQAHGDVRHHARTDVSVRDLTVTIDEPNERGGTNQGATPTETLVIALIGCTTVVAHRIADRLGIELANMSVDVAADFDRRGVMQEEHLTVPFPKMELTISVATSASQDDMEQLKLDLRKFCPISNMIRQSGTELTETWNVTRPG